MSDISTRLMEMVSKSNISFRDLERKTDIPKSAIQRYTVGETRKIPLDRLEALADALGTNAAYLLGWTNDRRKDFTITPNVLRIPVLGSIPAGIPLEAIEDIIDWEEIPASMARGDKEYFALKLNGDSMYPKYENGDVVIFLKQESCETGQDCAVMVNGDDATFKRVKLTPDGIALHPLNPAYDVRFYPNKEVRKLPVRIIGVAVEVRRKI